MLRSLSSSVGELYSFIYEVTVTVANFIFKVILKQLHSVNASFLATTPDFNTCSKHLQISYEKSVKRLLELHLSVWLVATI